MPYHTIVKTVARKNFERVNDRDFKSLLNDCAPNVTHRFGGSHALGGTRHDKEALSKWLDRLALCGPGLHLTVKDVWVKGWPWNTVVIVRWEAEDKYPDGRPYSNHGVHIVKMKWGKIYEIDANEDSQVVAGMLKERFDAGVKEAGMPMIES